jgi:hypothetical protein
MDVSIARGMALIRSALHCGRRETPATAGQETGATGSRGARGEGEGAQLLGACMCGPGGPHYSRPGGRRYKAAGAKAQILSAFYGTTEVVPFHGCLMLFTARLKSCPFTVASCSLRHD